jgi:hypothetical protein
MSCIPSWITPRTKSRSRMYNQYVIILAWSASHLCQQIPRQPSRELPLWGHVAALSLPSDVESEDVEAGFQMERSVYDSRDNLKDLKLLVDSKN